MGVKNILGYVLKHVGGHLEMIVLLFIRNLLLSVITFSALVFESST